MGRRFAFVPFVGTIAKDYWRCTTVKYPDFFEPTRKMSSS
jgi:hypothetical protein